MAGFEPVFFGGGRSKQVVLFKGSRGGGGVGFSGVYRVKG